GGFKPTVIFTFTNAAKTGWNPNGTPVLDSAGNLYGTTLTGGANGGGTAYKLTPAKVGKWTEQILHAFGTPNSHPLAGLVFDSSGNLYGTTSQGGRFGDGTVFELAPSNGSYTFKVLLAFTGDAGNTAYASMIWGGGHLYGTTFLGGSSGNGTVF